MGQVQSVVDYQINGISTLPNQFSQVPQQPVIGCLAAQEFVATRDGMLSTRRGWQNYIDLGTPTPYGNILSQTEFQNYLVFWTDQNIIGYTLDGSSFTQLLNNYEPPTPSDPASRVRFFQSNNNLYWTSSVGIWKLDGIENNPILAGAPQALDCTATTTQVNGGFLNSDASVSYRIQWQYYDANNNLVVGPPSNEIQVVNTYIGKQIINVGGAVTGSSATGLANSSTVYNASILVNGSDNIALNITGSAAQTYTALLSLINTALNGVATASISSGNLLISSTLVQGSAISWADGSSNPLAASLTGFVAIETPTDGTAEVNLSFMIPLSIANTSGTVPWSYAIYRGNQSAASIDPGDDNGQQVYVGTPTSGQITARIVTYTDNLPDAVRGATIDTAPSQQGIGAADFMPPLAQDVFQYRGYTFYANTQSNYTLDFTLTSVGSPDGIQTGDTITVSYGATVFTITGAASEDTSTGKFLVYTSGDAATNIELTSQSIVRVLNLYGSNTVTWAQYVSTVTDLPGQMNMTSLSLPGTAFYINSSRGGAFSPNLPSSGLNSSNTAINQVSPNQLMLSKYLQPESVPVGVPGGIIQVGSTNFPILRIMANRTSMFIFKGGPEGVFYIQGASGPTPGATASGFVLQPFDNTVQMTNENVCDLLNNSIFIMTNQGGVSVSDATGVQLICRPIQRDMLALQSLSNFNKVVNSVGYQSEFQWVVNVPTLATDTTATQSLVYNYITQQWTQWNRPFTSMFVRPSVNLLYAAAPYNNGSSVNSYLKVERKTFTNADYVDETFDVSVNIAGPVVNGTQTLTLSTVADLQTGQYVTQGNYSAVIAFVYQARNQVVIDVQGDTITTGPATVSQPIFNYFMSHPITNFAQGVVKKWSEATILVLDTQLEDLTLSFFTDWAVLESAAPVDLGPQLAITGAFGTGAYGQGPFALNQSNLNNRLRSYIPRPYAYSNWIHFILQATCLNGPLNLEGIGVVCENISTVQR